MIETIKKCILVGDYEIVYITHFRRFAGIPVNGLIEPDNDRILIKRSLDRREKVITIIHEFLHELKPKWSEEKVEEYSQRLYTQLTPEDHDFFNRLL